MKFKKNRFVTNFDSSVDVLPVDPYWDPHEHVLRPLYDPTLQLEQVRPLQGLHHNTTTHNLYSHNLSITVAYL